jgi:hypothetical protein
MLKLFRPIVSLTGKRAHPAIEEKHDRNRDECYRRERGGRENVDLLEAIYPLPCDV